MKPPCYDTKNKKDCEDRCVGCSATCKRWSEYVKLRQKVYDERLKEMHNRYVSVRNKLI